MNIFLTGFAGSGKSTIAPLLARSLNCPLVDLDARVAKVAGLTIPALFRLQGEKRFREIESSQLAHYCVPSQRMVVALGGGTLLHAGNRRLLKRAGVLVYLSCATRELERRTRSATDRPLLAGKEEKPDSRSMRLHRIRDLLEARKPGYEMADIRVSTTSRTPGAVTRLIRERLKQYHG